MHSQILNRVSHYHWSPMFISSSLSSFSAGVGAATLNEVTEKKNTEIALISTLPIMINVIIIDTIIIIVDFQLFLNL